MNEISNNPTSNEIQKELTDTLQPPNTTANTNNNCSVRITLEFTQINKNIAKELIEVCNTSNIQPVILDSKWKAYFDEENAFINARRKDIQAENEITLQKTQASDGKFYY